ncbi:HAD-IA family hydrolase [Dactylosporangium sp. NPDC000521]|uniref:HAD-IA family hydrolase n=1 Tax=Dactylosporangium sp. NPDC000521 TaxID=3363975 RepID=UPI0036C20E2B
MKAVLLDMDGTLVDSDGAVERAWHRWAAEHAVPIEVLAPILHGNPAATTIRVVRPDLDDTAVAAAAQRNLELQYDDLADVTATPGAARLLRTLDELGVPWAVVTSADRRLATVRLHAAGLPVRHLVTVEDTPRGKPDPAPYLAGAALLGADPRDCLVVEDSQPGIDAGRAAGMRVAALRGLPGDLRIRDLDELADTVTAGTAP